MPDTSTLKPGDPFCGNCGYRFAGLTESSKCPECGLPLVEVLKRAGGLTQAGRRYRSKVTIMGMPAIDIAFGPTELEPKGKARGFVAIGDDALGMLAIGGTARGFVAIGGAAVGVFSLGGFSAGLLTALGGSAVSAGLACGGGAIGGVARGGGAVGFIADGGMAVGYYARGGGAIGRHTISAGSAVNSPEAMDLFDAMGWLLGTGLNLGSFLYTVVLGLFLIVVLGGSLGWFGWMKDRKGSDEG